MAPITPLWLHIMSPRVPSSNNSHVMVGSNKKTSRVAVVSSSAVSPGKPSEGGGAHHNNLPKKEPFSQSRISRLMRERSLLEKAEQALSGMYIYSKFKCTIGRVSSLSFWTQDWIVQVCKRCTSWRRCHVLLFWLNLCWSGCRSVYGVGRWWRISLLGGTFGVREYQGCSSSCFIVPCWKQFVYHKTFVAVAGPSFAVSCKDWAMEFLWSGINWSSPVKCRRIMRRNVT